MVTKRAFTMIEMIFAIVIIGITVAGVSQMLTRSSDTMEGSLSQEAVFLASMEAAKVFSHRWDSNSEDSTTELSYSKILDTSSAGYNRVCIDPATNVRSTQPCTTSQVLSVLRFGGIDQDLHRRFHSTPTASLSGVPEGVPNSDSNLSLTGENGYKHDYNIVIASNYVSTPYNIGSPSGTSDIKRTVITVADAADTSTNLVTMRVYTYNIGEIDFAKRTFQ